MATDIYLKLDGITGECEAKGHEKEIEILSWSHGFSQPTSPVRSSSGATVEKANHQDITFSKYLDSATDEILGKCWNGDQIKTAILSCWRADGKNTPVEYLNIKMEKVVVSTYSIGGGGGDIPIENVTLSYGKVVYTYKDQKKADGTGGSAKPISHDLIKNEVGTK